MDKFVAGQLVRAGEPPLAYWAHERSHTQMTADVSQQLLPTDEAVGASLHGANERPGAAMSPQMVSHAGRIRGDESAERALQDLTLHGLVEADRCRLAKHVQDVFAR
jgi:hypothetical protein